MSGKRIRKPRRSRVGADGRLSSRLDSHLHEALVENARWLMNECGLSHEGAANRLGVSPNTLEKALLRHPEKQSA